jgi:hypothetical protein
VQTRATNIHTYIHIYSSFCSIIFSLSYTCLLNSAAMSTRGQFNTKNPTIKRICKLSSIAHQHAAQPNKS